MLTPEKLQKLYASKELGKALRKNIPKPVETEESKWIAPCYNTTKILLKHYGEYLTHLEKLPNNDTRLMITAANLRVFQCYYPIHLAIYLDTLAALIGMSLNEQKDKHDPIKAVNII